MTDLFTFRPAVLGELARSARVLDGMMAFAEKAVEIAKATAPVSTDPSDPTPGSFRDSIHAERTADGAAVVSDDPAAVYIEYGTSRTPTFATLRHAAAAAGGKFGGA